MLEFYLIVVTAAGRKESDEDGNRAGRDDGSVERSFVREDVPAK